MEVFKDEMICLSPSQEITTNKEILDLIGKGNCCFNAFMISRIFNIDYCEGYYIDEDGVIVNHCFNRNGERYYDFTNSKFNPEIQKVFLKRVFKTDEIKEIFNQEKKIFITFQGYATKQNIVRYDDSLNRELTNHCIINKKDIGKILILIEKLKSLVGEIEDKDEINKVFSFIEELKNN